MKKKGWIARFLAGICVFAVAFSACKGEESEEIFVYAPDGAPALALARLIAEDTEEDGVSYRVVAPTLISSKVTAKKESENADVCVLPVTAASKLLGEGDRYQMLGVVTHGNLYLLAKEGRALNGLSSLLGKTVGVLQMNEVPGLTFKATLQKEGIAYQEMTNDGGRVENTVNLLAISGEDAVGTVDADYFLLAEPAASLQAKKGYAIVGDLQALYGGEKGYPQAVLVAKKTLVETRLEWVEEFTEGLVAGGEWLQTADGETLVSLVTAHLEDKTAATSLKAATLTADVLGRCGIYFTYADACVLETEEFLNDLILVNAKAAAIPSAAFYWQRKGEKE